MFKKLIISLAMLFAGSLICMEEGNSGKKNKLDESLALTENAKKQKPKAFDKWLYLPQEIWTQIIYFMIQDCKDTKEICKHLKYFALTCKNFKNLIKGQGLTTSNTFIAKEVQRQVNKLLYSTLFKPFFDYASEHELDFSPGVNRDQLDQCINPNLIRTLIDTQKLWINAKVDKFDKTALMKMIRTAIGNDWAAFSDKLFHSSNFLLGDMLSLPELDVNAKDVNLNTALLLAVDDRVASGDYKAEGAAYEWIYALLKHPKIDVNAKNDNGYSALKLAVHCADYEIVYLLLDKSEPIVDDSIISLAKQRLEELHAQDPAPMDEINRFVNIIELLEKHVENKMAQNTLKEFESFDCSICLERAEQGKDLAKKLTCNHMFHKDCINGWLKTQNACPLCRKQQ